MTNICVHKTELSNLTKNEIVLPPKHGAPPSWHQCTDSIYPDSLTALHTNDGLILVDTLDANNFRYHHHWKSSFTQISVRGRIPSMICLAIVVKFLYIFTWKKYTRSGSILLVNLAKEKELHLDSTLPSQYLEKYWMN